MLHARSVTPGTGGQLVRLLAAAARLYAMDATGLLPALAGVRPLPGEAPLPPPAAQDAAAIRR